MTRGNLYLFDPKGRGVASVFQGKPGEERGKSNSVGQVVDRRGVETVDQSPFFRERGRACGGSLKTGTRREEGEYRGSVWGRVSLQGRKDRGKISVGIRETSGVEGRIHHIGAISSSVIGRKECVEAGAPIAVR